MSTFVCLTDFLICFYFLLLFFRFSFRLSASLSFFDDLLINAFRLQRTMRTESHNNAFKMPSGIVIFCFSFVSKLIFLFCRKLPKRNDFFPLSNKLLSFHFSVRSEGMAFSQWPKCSVHLPTISKIGKNSKSFNSIGDFKRFEIFEIIFQSNWNGFLVLINFDWGE